MKRIMRDRHLTPEEAAEYDTVRQQIEQEKPEINARIRIGVEGVHMQRCGIVEIGTRGIRLVVAHVSHKNPRGFEVLRTKGALVNLGNNLSPENPYMSLDRMEAASTTVEEFFREASDFQPDHIVVLATEVLRRAQNANEFCDMLPRGLPIYILTPAQEAALSYRAAADSFRGHHVRGGELPYGPLLLIDLGGGSAELVAGIFGGSPTETSIGSTLHLPDLGSLGLEALFEGSDGSSHDKVSFLASHVRSLWNTQPSLVFGSNHTVPSPQCEVVALGSATTELAWRLRGASPQSFRSRDVHGQRVDLAAAHEFSASIRDAMPANAKEMTDNQIKELSILFGIFVLDSILQSHNADHFRVCGFGLRFGAAASLLEDSAEFPPSAPESLTVPKI